MKIFCVKPATINPINEQTATKEAYGICVVTWSMWLHLAAVEERIVVSDIGEQWSPNTEPANVAARLITVSSGATLWHIVMIIGINIPKVPQDVPIENDSNAATIKIIAGIKAGGIFEASTRCAT